jgi:LacI family transcriptional regulator
MNLKELASQLGLSPTTVSRALNGFPEVNETRAAGGRSRAQRHNYRPNARAQGLATGRAMAIGHVIPISSAMKSSTRSSPTSSPARVRSIQRLGL